MDRAVAHERRDAAAQGQRRDAGGRLSMAPRHADPPPLAASAAAVATRPVRRGPGLVAADEAFGSAVGLAVTPRFAPPQDLRVLLFAAGRGLLARDGVTLEEAPDRAAAAGEPLLLAPNGAPRSGRAVVRPGRGRMASLWASPRWDVRPPPIALGRASPFSRSSARPWLLRRRARRGPGGRSPMRKTFRHRRQDPPTKIIRQQTRPPRGPPPSRTLTSPLIRAALTAEFCPASGGDGGRILGEGVPCLATLRDDNAASAPPRARDRPPPRRRAPPAAPGGSRGPGDGRFVSPANPSALSRRTQPRHLGRPIPQVSAALCRALPLAALRHPRDRPPPPRRPRRLPSVPPPPAPAPTPPARIATAIALPRRQPGTVPAAWPEAWEPPTRHQKEPRV
jgi:hypothetical protein